MWDWINSYTRKSEKEIILKAFPSCLKDDVEKVFDILPFSKHVFNYWRQSIRVDKLIHPDVETMKLNNEFILVPSRVYFNEPSKAKENTLTDIQKIILNCLYLRHHNGLVRQKRLELLISHDDYFIIPYKLGLLGDYVIEILVALNNQVTADNAFLYLKFVDENELYFNKIACRMATFWDLHYKNKYPKIKYYIGRKISDRIKKSRNSKNEINNRLPTE